MARVLIRAEGEGIVAIGQASHAWLSGQLARAWGGARLEAPEPWEEVCLAAEQHDVGMAEWDLAPRLHPREGRPESFVEMALAEHLRLWSAAPAKLLTQSRYAALLVSLHGSALYERRDLARLAPGDADAVRAYLAGEHARQERLIGLLGADREQLRRNQRLLGAWDGLSLALCLRWADYVASDLPTRDGGGVDVRLEPVAGDAEGGFAVDPWPFRAEKLTVRCEGRRLGARHGTEGELHAALENAPQAILDFTLVPSSHRPG